MHSKIFQISNKPIDKDEYASPSDYYDNSGDFADYIGDEIEGEDMDDSIGYLAALLKDVFTYEGGGVFVYKGADALWVFKQQWAEELQRLTAGLTPDNLLVGQQLYKIRATTKETHLRSDYRVDIAQWADGVAFPFGELFEYAASQLEKGDRIYVGAVIDYHY